MVGDARSLYLVDATGSLQSYAVADGTLQWSQASASTSTVPLVFLWDGLILVDGGEGFVNFYDAANGELLSSNQISGTLVDVVAIGSELIASSTAGVIYRFEHS